MKKADIFYIHGLGGGVNSAGYAGLKRHFENARCLLYPSQEAGFSENLETLCGAFFGAYGGGDALVVGSSLGGFYAGHLAEQIRKRAPDFQKVRLLLLNPAVEPYESARGNPGYPRALVDSYKGVEFAQARGFARAAVLTMDDEVLDPSAALHVLRGWRIFKFPTGGHRCWDALESDILRIAKRLLETPAQPLADADF